MQEIDSRISQNKAGSDRANVEAVRSFLVVLGRLTYGQGRSSGGVDKNGSSRVQRPFLEPSLFVESALRSQDPHYSLLPFSSVRFPPTPGTGGEIPIEEYQEIATG